MTIGWIEISKKKYGGIVYNEKAREILSEFFDLELISCEARFFKKIKYFKIPESLFCIWKLKGKKDLWIRDFYSTVCFFPKRTKGKNLVLIHHLDFSGFPLIARPFLNFLKNVFFWRNLKKADFILTVSEYWKNYFLQKGYSNVYKIYNGFDLSNFNISEKEIIEFKRKYNLNDKPIIYLGNCQKAKGVVESYNALKNLNVHLVTSGKRNVKIPTWNFDLDYREYLILLKASSIVLTMSKFKEGWCRTAHEAMLLKTPVIGSGSGGMRELLEGGGQIVCERFKDLKEKVDFLLKNPLERKKIGSSGFAFAKRFTLEKFKEDWLNLVKKFF